MRESRAYNQSIYLMVSMPYVVLGVFGFIIYRGYNKGRVDGRVSDVQRFDAS
jgi:hypothetical protein